MIACLRRSLGVVVVSSIVLAGGDAVAAGHRNNGHGSQGHAMHGALNGHHGGSLIGQFGGFGRGGCGFGYGGYGCGFGYGGAPFWGFGNMPYLGFGGYGGFGGFYGPGGAFPGNPFPMVGPPLIQLPTEPASGTIVFRVPDDAFVWVDGQLLPQVGSRRQYTTPILPPGGADSFPVRIRWVDKSGKTHTYAETVTVHAGKQATVMILK